MHTLNLGGLSMERTPDATAARFVACRSQPRTYAAREAALFELTDTLAEVCGLDLETAECRAERALVRAGWKFRR